MSILQLNPPLDVTTPFGKGCAIFYQCGVDDDCLWTVVQDEMPHGGEVWTWRNRYVRFEKNITRGRLVVSEIKPPEGLRRS